jgi:hypothetical protein
MRRVFHFDGLDGGVLSVGECTEPERLALCITNDGHETHMLISRDEWYALFSVRYEIKFVDKQEEEGDEQKLKAVQ